VATMQVEIHNNSGMQNESPKSRKMETVKDHPPNKQQANDKYVTNKPVSQANKPRSLRFGKLLRCIRFRHSHEFARIEQLH